MKKQPNSNPEITQQDIDPYVGLCGDYPGSLLSLSAGIANTVVDNITNHQNAGQTLAGEGETSTELVPPEDHEPALRFDGDHADVLGIPVRHVTKAGLSERHDAAFKMSFSVPLGDKKREEFREILKEHVKEIGEGFVVISLAAAAAMYIRHRKK